MIVFKHEPGACYISSPATTCHCLFQVSYHVISSLYFNSPSYCCRSEDPVSYNRLYPPHRFPALHSLAIQLQPFLPASTRVESSKSPASSRCDNLGKKHVKWVIFTRAHARQTRKIRGVKNANKIELAHTLHPLILIDLGCPRCRITHLALTDKCTHRSCRRSTTKPLLFGSMW